MTSETEENLWLAAAIIVLWAVMASAVFGGGPGGEAPAVRLSAKSKLQQAQQIYEMRQQTAVDANALLVEARGQGRAEAEIARLKAEADKAKAEAAEAKSEAEKLRLEVEKAVIDIKKSVSNNHNTEIAVALIGGAFLLLAAIVNRLQKASKAEGTDR